MEQDRRGIAAERQQQLCQRVQDVGRLDDHPLAGRKGAGQQPSRAIRQPGHRRRGRAAPAKADHIVQQHRLAQAHGHAGAVQRGEQQGRSAERRMEQETHRLRGDRRQAVRHRHVMARAGIAQVFVSQERRAAVIGARDVLKLDAVRAFDMAVGQPSGIGQSKGRGLVHRPSLGGGARGRNCRLRAPGRGPIHQP